MLNYLKKLVPGGLKRSVKKAMGFQSMETRLQNLRRSGFSCSGAIDVGAYHGEWSKALRFTFDVPVVLVEPELQCEPFLETYINTCSNGTWLEGCALGKEAGNVEFLLQETNSQVLNPGSGTLACKTRVEMRTLKDLLSRYTEDFNLLKVDVQGFELDVLEGAFEVLDQFEVIILEVSIISIGKVPTFYEVMQYMHAKGYRLYDFLPMYYRPLDNALWQGDAIFVRNDSSLVSSLQWSSG